MENVFLTSLTIPEVKQLFRDEIRTFFDTVKPASLPLPGDSIFNIDQAAEFLGLGKPTLYTKVSRKEIPYMKIKNSKRLYFSKDELTAWIKSGRKDAIKEMEVA